MNNKRPSIAVLAGGFDQYNNKIIDGIKDAATLCDLSVLYFLNGIQPGKENIHRNQTSLHRFVKNRHIDGLILPTAALLSYCPWDLVEMVQELFSGIPTVSVSAEIPNIPSILIDNESGLFNLVLHLIKEHKYKKIAFIKGSANNPEAEKRFCAYKKALKVSNIDLDQKLVVSGHFDFQFNSEETKKAIDKLLKNGQNFDAIVCSNDYIAYNAVVELKKHGIRCPEDVAVTGFDNNSLSQAMRPALTTVNQNLRDIGKKSILLLNDLLLGKEVPLITTLAVSTIIRSSCGCSHFKHRKDSIKNYDKNSASFRDIICKELNNDSIFLELCLYLEFSWQQNIDFYFDLIEKSKSLNEEGSLLEFEKKIGADIKKYTSIKPWKIIVAAIVHNILLFYKHDNFQNIIQFISNSSTVISQVSENKEAFNLIESNASDFELNRISSELVLCTDFKTLQKIVITFFPRLGLQSCFICLYDKKITELLCGYTTIENKFVEYKSQKFPSSQILPDAIKLYNERSSYVINELFYKDKIPGYVLFDKGLKPLKLFEQLSSQISSVLSQINHNENLKGYTKELEKKVNIRTAKLLSLNRKLEKINSTKNDFIANITHDFRSPLTVILNLADINVNYTDDNPCKKDFEMILASAYRMKSFVDCLLDLAKLDSENVTLNITQFDPCDFIKEVVGYYESAITNTGITISMLFPEDSVHNFYSDKEKLDEIISNIISNAIKFIDINSGKIVIEVIDSIEFLTISIKDDGVGIPVDKLKAIFERYEQLTNGRNAVYGGSGIGLAFAKQLTKYMHGTIWAESEGDGKGATFKIQFPKGDHYDVDKGLVRKQDSFLRDQQKSMIEYEIKKKSEKPNLNLYLHKKNAKDEYDIYKALILIIDDEIGIAEIIKKYLAGNNFTNFIIASSGRLGLQAFFEHNPDLILCDYNMPHLMGSEVHDKIAEDPKYKDTPFIFLSAVGDQKIINERKKKGAFDYLKKPIDKDELIFAVKFHLKKHFDQLLLESKKIR